MSCANRLVEGFAGSASRALPADRTLVLALLAAAEERQVPVGARWEYNPLLEVGTFRLGTLAFVPGVVYRTSALDEEGAAPRGDGDTGRAAGGARRAAACMQQAVRFRRVWAGGEVKPPAG